MCGLGVYAYALCVCVCRGVRSKYCTVGMGGVCVCGCEVGVSRMLVQVADNRRDEVMSCLEYGVAVGFKGSVLRVRCDVMQCHGENVWVWCL